MQIARHASVRNRDTTTFVSDWEPQTPIVKVSSKPDGIYEDAGKPKWTYESGVSLAVPYVPDADGRSHHDYEVWLSLDDVRKVFAAVAQECGTIDGSAIRRALDKDVLIKLLSCAAGLLPQQPATENNAAA